MPVAAQESLLLTDLFQLNMIQGYEDGGFYGLSLTAASPAH